MMKKTRGNGTRNYCFLLCQFHSLYRSRSHFRVVWLNHSFRNTFLCSCIVFDFTLSSCSVVSHQSHLMSGSMFMWITISITATLLPHFWTDVQVIEFFRNYQQHKIDISADHFFLSVSFVKFSLVTQTFFWKELLNLLINYYILKELIWQDKYKKI